MAHSSEKWEQFPTVILVAISMPEDEYQRKSNHILALWKNRVSSTQRLSAKSHENDGRNLSLWQVTYAEGPGRTVKRGTLPPLASAPTGPNKFAQLGEALQVDRFAPHVQRVLYHRGEIHAVHDALDFIAIEGNHGAVCVRQRLFQPRNSYSYSFMVTWRPRKNAKDTKKDEDSRCGCRASGSPDFGTSLCQN